MLEYRGYTNITTDGPDVLAHDPIHNESVVARVHTSTFGKSDARALYEMHSDKSHLVLVCNQCSHQAVSWLHEQFDVADVLCSHNINVCIMEHCMVPRYTRLCDTEVARLYAHFGKSSLLPVMSSKDPVAMYMGYRKGDVLKVERTSTTTGYSVYYRIVEG